MRRALNNAKISEWAESLGGKRQATILLMEELKCGTSKAEKIAGGRYPSLPTPLEQDVLVRLTGFDYDLLFPLVGAKRRRAS
jgi:hypothetical protein